VRSDGGARERKTFWGECTSEEIMHKKTKGNEWATGVKSEVMLKTAITIRQGEFAGNLCKEEKQM